MDGRSFTVFTDHKPLTFAFTKVSDAWSNRQQRHLAAISKFTTDVRHIAGKRNVVADALSRATLGSVLTSIQQEVDYVELAKDKQCQEIKDYRTSTTGLRFEEIPVGAANVPLLCDVSTGVPLTVVPSVCRKKIFDVIHGLSHPSIRATRRLTTSKFVWHGFQKQVGQWAKQCISCQKSKIHQHVKSSLQAYPPPIRRFDHVNIDIVGSLPPSQGNHHLLTMVDRFTRCPEAVPMADATTLSCARAFLMNWVERFGVPQDISTDRGPQFTSDLREAFNQLLGIRIHRTTAYHPQASGLVERFHCHLKSALMARLTGPNWVDVPFLEFELFQKMIFIVLRLSWCTVLPCWYQESCWCFSFGQ